MQYNMRFRRPDAAGKAKDRFWHEIEGAPLDEVGRVQEQRLTEQMAYLKASSPFYQEKFANAGVDFDEIRTVEDLQRLPYTYKSEIRESLAADAGMLFDYERPQPVAMWMKNTYIPLDMIFIDNDGIITHISTRAVPLSLQPISSKGPVRAVLEVNGGITDHLGITVGDEVRHAIFGNDHKR